MNLTKLFLLTSALLLSLNAMAADAPAKAETKPVPTKTDAKAPVTELPPLPPLPSVAEDPAEQRKQAFNVMMDSQSPLNPDEIRLLRKKLDEIQRAKSESPNVAPKPWVGTIPVSIEPGVVPPVIRLSTGFVTSVLFMDATGAPWPVVHFDIGGSDTVDVQQPDPGKGNQLTISPKGTYLNGNMSVLLQGQPTPILISLVSNQPTVDFRADLRVQSRGPNAAAPVAQGDTQAGRFNPVMVKALDATMPEGAQLLQADKGTVKAWKYKGKMYLRTNMTLLSPAWSDHVGSAEGMHAYEVPETPVVLLSDHGNPLTIKIGATSWTK